MRRSGEPAPFCPLGLQAALWASSCHTGTGKTLSCRRDSIWVLFSCVAVTNVTEKQNKTERGKTPCLLSERMFHRLGPCGLTDEADMPAH